MWHSVKSVFLSWPGSGDPRDYHSGLARGAEESVLWDQHVSVFTCTVDNNKECWHVVSLGLMVLNSVLKVVSLSTSLLIRYNKVREGCVYLSKLHNSEEAYASVTSSFVKHCPVKFSEELSGWFPADTGNVPHTNTLHYQRSFIIIDWNAYIYRQLLTATLL